MTDQGNARTWAAAAELVTRVAVPLWILAGALFKLFAGSPSTLPSVVIKLGGAVGLDLAFVLHFMIGVELVVIGVMWLLPSLARLAGAALLSVFMLTLVGELANGAASCGCFGTVTVHPAITMAVDGLLLAAILVLGPRSKRLRFSRTLPAVGVVAVLLWTVASFAVAFGLPAVNGRKKTHTPAAAKAATATAGNASQASTAPPGYYLPDYKSWLGRKWNDLEIAKWVRGLPADVDQGERYLVFYRKDCEHCHLLLEEHFSGQLPFPTTVIAVPERAGFPTAGVLPMPCTQCSQAELPSGCDWFMQTPVVVRLNGGVVECAAEVNPDTPECLQW